jgi:Vacuolar protein sorting-associated protein 62
MSNLGIPPTHVIRTGKKGESAKGEPTLIVSNTSYYTWLYDDRGSGATMDVTIWRPIPSDNSFYIIGDYAQGNYSAPVGSSFIVEAINDDPKAPLLKEPVDYNEVWNDHGSRGNHDGSIWYPVPPNGYITIGFVGQTGYTKPYIPNYRCVRRDLTTPAQAGALIWDDKKSGANMDVSLYQILGVPSAFVAQGSYGPYTGPCNKLAID